MSTTVEQHDQIGVSHLPVDAVVFREDLYPRIETSAVTVQKYAEDLDVLPPIEVNQHNELIDGWHRWTAHKKAKAEQIRVVVTPTGSDAELLEFAIERNAAHGLQLSQDDKRKMAVQIYQATPRKEQSAKKIRLQQILSVSASAVEKWLSRTDKDLKDEAKRTAQDAWLACYTQDEISAIVEWPQQTVADWIKDFTDFSKLAESGKAAASHAVDFEPPLYNIWKQQEKSRGSSHFGNSEVRWLDNLLYLYTQPFDIVIDPFAGGGSTIDICRKRLRRYWVSDRLPVVERAKEIRQHDITTGLPPLPRWQDVALVYLDPPYWKQAEGQYSTDAADFANMPLDEFTKALASTINGFAKKLSAGAVIALLIQPTQWKAPERGYVDHIADMIRLVKLPIDMRISAPYESQQCNAQMVEWAKEQKRVLVLTRELVIWRVA